MSGLFGTRGVAHARRGVQVDQGRAPGDLSEGVGHRDGGGLLQRQYVAEITGEFLQEGFLGRTWITEDGRQSEGPQQIVSHTSDGGFLGHALLSQPPAGRAPYQAHETELTVRALLTMTAPPDWRAMNREKASASGGRVMPNDSMRTVLVALGSGLAVAVAKAVVAVVTGSSAMAAEASHSLADTANDLFLFVAQRHLVVHRGLRRAGHLHRL